MPAAREITLGTPLEALGPAAKKAAPAMRLLGVTNVGQLIAYLPMRHEFQEAEATIDKLTPETLVTARGEVTATRVVNKRPRPRFEAVLMDQTGRLDLVWFNMPHLRHKIHPGMRLRVSGKVKRFGPGLQIANPRIEVLRDGNEPESSEARLRPIYPASEDMPSRRIEKLVESVLDRALPLIEDHLSEEYRRERNLPSLAEAYRMMHRPQTREEPAAARRRLAYDELLMLQLGVEMKRVQLRTATKAPALRWNEAVDAHIRARLPFPLTPAQDEVVREVAADLSRSVPTNRLIQGDVGSGKTVVALYAMLMAVASRHQAALMVPTELLAEQHFASISAMLAGSDVRVELLTGSVTGSMRENLLARLARGEVDILIGTHALLTERVRFASLAVAVIDEQHRFGVHQRAGLREKGTAMAALGEPAPRPGAQPTGDGQAAADGGAEAAGATGEGSGGAGGLAPHMLVMTATPIPRTIAITLFGDLDVSTIRGLPPGRRPVTTRLVGPEKWDDVYAYVRKRVDEGDQAYVVVPAIDTGAEEGLNDLRTVQARLVSPGGPLDGKRVAAVHGRLAPQTREHIMQRFRAGLIDVLVATTVIEVGVDVPNATIMVIEHAERFGLAQLHQLRGRVGRGSKTSVCVLIAEPQTEEARARLRVVAGTSDGFALAEKDLEIRGPGEVFGTRQAGVPPFKVADLLRDRDLLALARRDASAWVARSPILGLPNEVLLRRRLIKAHGAWLGLGDVG